MALESDVLGVVLQYVDGLDKSTPHRRDAGDSVSEKTLFPSPADGAVLRGGAECRCVSRTWRVSVEEILLRALPPMSSRSLAALLVPGRLYFVLLSCRYLEQHEHTAATAYTAVASRAEVVGLRLHQAAATTVGAAAAPAGPASLATPAESGVADGPEAPAVGTPTLLIVQNLGAAAADEGKPNRTSCASGKYGDLCYRIALKRIVQEALDSPAFSWCSSLGRNDSRLLEGCVGASSLLHARWFSK